MYIRIGIVGRKLVLYFMGEGNISNRMLTKDNNFCNFYIQMRTKFPGGHGFYKRQPHSEKGSNKYSPKTTSEGQDMV